MSLCLSEINRTLIRNTKTRWAHRNQKRNFDNDTTNVYAFNRTQSACTISFTSMHTLSTHIIFQSDQLIITHININIIIFIGFSQGIRLHNNINSTYIDGKNTSNWIEAQQRTTNGIQFDGQTRKHGNDYPPAAKVEYGGRKTMRKICPYATLRLEPRWLGYIGQKTRR